jgi:hypothetical protein
MIETCVPSNNDPSKLSNTNFVIYQSKKIGASFNFSIKNCYEMFGFKNNEHEKRRFDFRSFLLNFFRSKVFFSFSLKHC